MWFEVALLRELLRPDFWFALKCIKLSLFLSQVGGFQIARCGDRFHFKLTLLTVHLLWPVYGLGKKMDFRSCVSNCVVCRAGMHK